MENQIGVVERGAFDDMKELERLWVSMGAGSGGRWGLAEGTKAGWAWWQEPVLHTQPASCLQMGARGSMEGIAASLWDDGKDSWRGPHPKF